MAKKIDGYIKLNIPAGGANPSPPVGKQGAISSGAVPEAPELAAT